MAMLLVSIAKVNSALVVVIMTTSATPAFLVPLLGMDPKFVSGSDAKKCQQAFSGAVAGKGMKNIRVLVRHDYRTCMYSSQVLMQANLVCFLLLWVKTG